MPELWRTTSHHGDVMPQKEGNRQTKNKSSKTNGTGKTESNLCSSSGKTIEKIGLQTKRTDYVQTALDRIGLTSVIMIMDAHIHNIIKPGSYNRRLNQTLSRNGISSIELETPDSE